MHAAALAAGAERASRAFGPAGDPAVAQFHRLHRGSTVSRSRRLQPAPAESCDPRLLALTAAPGVGRRAARRPARTTTSTPSRRPRTPSSPTLDEAQIDSALAGHPRIGERADGLDEESAARSAREQVGDVRADDRRPGRVARGNAEYEKRFGRIYLVAAAGRSADELLSLLRERLGNDPGTELDVVRGELARIPESASATNCVRGTDEHLHPRPRRRRRGSCRRA